MLGQITALGKAFLTDLTLVRLLPGVDANVALEDDLFTESLGTLLTLEGLLAGVDHSMGLQMLEAHEALRADVALERLLAGVDDLVAGEVVALVVGLVTHVALVVQFFVYLELAVEPEGLGAEVALEPFDPRVDGIMVLKLRPADEHLMTDVTLFGLLPRVSFPMHLTLLLRFEQL